MVEYVEEFRADFESFRLRYRDSLRDAQIGVIDSRTMEEPSIRRSEAAAIGTGQNSTHQVADRCGKCALVKICERARRIARVVDVNRSHNIRHICGGTAG